MGKFAKLFNLGENQVLVTLGEYDDDKGVTHLIQITDIEGVEIKVKLGFKNETKAQEAFDSYNRTNAIKFFNQAGEMFDIPEYEDGKIIEMFPPLPEAA